ncbi:MAG: porin [Chitinophagaceae bacterium]|nr:MAG: porin [Chitinophagaceae bacterium]
MDIDSSFFIRDTVRPTIKRLENIRIVGYIQPQFQVAQSMGTSSYSGGNFSQYSSNRFMLRRARLRIEYVLPSKGKTPNAIFAFQLDASERGVITRDIFIRLFETKKNNFSTTIGLFARPFGYELNLSSSTRETPERGRMSQILMPSERDLGMMISYEPQTKKQLLKQAKVDAGFFNGQGLAGTTDFDSYKDFISRLTVRPFKWNKMTVSGGASLLRGNFRNGTKFIYTTQTTTNGSKSFIVDSVATNFGKAAPRHYYGVDVQTKFSHGWGETELRAEYWMGTQSGTSSSSVSPGVIPNSNGIPVPTYIRNFNGAFFYLLQNIVNKNNQFLVKYDWYDPNVKVDQSNIGNSGANFTATDIKYSTLGIGFVHHINSQTKLIFYYDFVKNEKTKLAGYTNDLKDNILTCRLQFKF